VKGYGEVSLLCELGLDKVKRGEEKEVEEEEVQEENKSVAIAIFNTVTFTTPPPPHPPLHRRRPSATYVWGISRLYTIPGKVGKVVFERLILN
jgi:hypothetical protein